MGTYDNSILKSIKTRKKSGDDFSETYERLFDIDISKDEARKRLKGIENYLEHKSKGNEPPKEKEFTEEEELEYLQLAEEYTKLKKRYQNMQDKLRIERKYIRKQSREDNIRESLLDNISDFDKFNFEEYHPLISTSYEELIIQIGDSHIGQFIEGKFNYNIAKERLIKLFSKARRIAFEKGISNITLAFTGDIFNLNHVMDKLLTNEKVRSDSLKIGFEMFSSCIDLLLRDGYNLSIVGVLGNESRVDSQQYMSNVTRLAVDSFDYLLFILLHTRYSEGVTFINMCDEIETVVNINGKNIGMTHGHRLKHSQLIKEISSLKLRIFEETGVMIDYTIFGHVHQTLVTPYFARCGSLVGADEYSSIGLNIPMSRASQNIIVIGDDIEVTPINLD